MTALIAPRRARAYVNFGRWVADCPWDCGSAAQLQPHQAVFQCIECHSISEIDWPGNADEIWEALGKRRAPRNRNWYPEGHLLAVRAGIPHGQSVKQLEDETAEFEVS